MSFNNPIHFIHPDWMWSVDTKGHNLISGKELIIDSDEIEAILMPLKIGLAVEDDGENEKEE